jgi:glycosyltransferase involved in cell wall biosynthesis
VPSIFPEAFGMVAAEAAAGGSLPLVARHSGLAEIAEGLEQACKLPSSFESGNASDLASKLRELLALAAGERRTAAAAARRTVEERWSWATVAARLLEPPGK